jgi:hypothetical protein
MKERNLFGDTMLDPATKAPEYINTEAIAATGDARASTYDPNIRHSEVYEDLGGGVHTAGVPEPAPKEPAEDTTTPTSAQTNSKKRYFGRAAMIADQGEPDTDHDPAYSERVRLTQEQIAAGLRHTAENGARIAESRSRNAQLFAPRSDRASKDTPVRQYTHPETQAIADALARQKKWKI